MCRRDHYVYAPSSSKPVQARSAGCDYQVLTQAPSKPFDELGVLDVVARRGFVPENVGAFRNMASKQVCAAGGDAVIVLANGAGQYLKGTVIRWQAGPAPAPAAAP